jgi:hypothetical protein
MNLSKASILATGASHNCPCSSATTNAAPARPDGRPGLAWGAVACPLGLQVNKIKIAANRGGLNRFLEYLLSFESVRLFHQI